MTEQPQSSTIDSGHLTIGRHALRISPFLLRARVDLTHPLSVPPFDRQSRLEPFLQGVFRQYEVVKIG